MVLIGFLACVGLGYLLPMTPMCVLLRIGLLFGGLIWVFLYLNTPALSFFLAALLGLLLFHQPLEVYVAALIGQTQSLTVFMLVLFGGTLAVVSRQGLLHHSRAPVQIALGLRQSRFSHPAGRPGSGGRDTLSVHEWGAARLFLHRYRLDDVRLVALFHG
jgi:hypothetical protein